MRLGTDWWWMVRSRGRYSRATDDEHGEKSELLYLGHLQAQNERNGHNDESQICRDIGGGGRDV